MQGTINIKLCYFLFIIFTPPWKYHVQVTVLLAFLYFAYFNDIIQEKKPKIQVAVHGIY